MRFSARASVACLALLGLCGVAAAQDGVVGPTFEVPAGDPAYAPDHVLVRFQDGVTPDQINGANAQAGVLEVVFDYAPLVPGLYCVRVAPGSVAQAIASYRNDASVRYAEVDYIRYACVQTTPYGITMVHAPEV